MSNVEHILLHTGLSPEQVAERLAESLGATLTRHEQGEVSVRRVVSTGNAEGTVGGLVAENDEYKDHPETDVESIYNGYDTLYEIWSTIPREDLQHADAKTIFSEITARLHWPAAHAEEGGSLYSAWDPKLGRTDFPPGTSVDSPHRDLWKAYAHPNLTG